MAENKKILLYRIDEQAKNVIFVVTEDDPKLWGNISEDMQTVLAVLISFGCVIGFAVVALLAVIGGYSQLTTLNILIFQGVWSLFVLLITRLKRLDI